MSDLDRQRRAAVAVLKRLGAQWLDHAWVLRKREGSASDLMRSLLMRRADALAVCVEGSAGKAELAAIGNALEEYEAELWAAGKVPD